MTGEATEEEMTWLREMVSNTEFIKRLSVYGNFMHGTHVAGIAAKDSEDIKLLISSSSTEVSFL